MLNSNKIIRTDLCGRNIIELIGFIEENLSAQAAKRFFEHELQPEKVSRAFRLCGNSGPGAIP